VLDFETTNKDKGSAQNTENSLVLSVGYERTAVRTDVNAEDKQPTPSLPRGRTSVVWGSEYAIQSIQERAERADFVVGHNIKFDLQWLERAGMDLHNVFVWDTLIAEYIIYAGTTSLPLNKLSLGETAKRYGLTGKEPYIDKCIKGGVCPSDLPRSMLERRCIYDVNVTHEIFLRQRDKLRELGLLQTMWTRCILTPVLANIESNGMALSKERVTKVYNSTLIEFNEVRLQLDEMCGGINLNSPKQLGEFIYDTLGIAELKNKRGEPIRTPSGGRKTDSETLASLKGRNKQQRAFLELNARYAFLNAKLTKSLNKYMACVEAEDILYARFNQTATKTQRLSSSGARYAIQFQNQAREFKPLFCARNKGWLIAEIDGAQLEFRVAAFLGQDYRAITDINNGFDVHSFTASQLRGVTLEEVLANTEAKGDWRQSAKSETFKPLYGGSRGTPEQERYYAAFREKYPGVAAAQQSWIDEALATQKVRTVTGLIYHYPNTKIQRGSNYVTNTTQICNYPVQGLATADIIPIALTYLWHELHSNGLRSFIVNTIHDSVVMEVHPDEVDIVREIAVKCFTVCVYNYLKEVYNIEFNVPLGTGFKCGEHWTEGKEIVESVEPPYEFSGSHL